MQHRESKEEKVKDSHENDLPVISPTKTIVTHCEIYVKRLTAFSTLNFDERPASFGRAFLSARQTEPGFPADFNPNHAAHVGLDLVGSLSRLSLNGTARYENAREGGARVRVTFPLPHSRFG